LINLLNFAYKMQTHIEYCFG